MKFDLVKSKNPEILILFFAGWGYSPKFLETLDSGECSILTLYDYGDISHCDIAQIRAVIAEFSDITLVAWSFGVFYADYLFDRIFMAGYLLPKKLVAINGTLFPVDDEYGIPENIFKGTLDGLDSRNLEKFYLRIAGSREVKHSYFDNNGEFGEVEIEGKREGKREVDIDSLKDELAAIYERALFPDSECSESRCSWTDVYLTREDMIFPYANSLRFWTEVYNLTSINLSSEEGAHFPFCRWGSWLDLIDACCAARKGFGNG